MAEKTDVTEGQIVEALRVAEMEKQANDRKIKGLNAYLAAKNQTGALEKQIGELKKKHDALVIQDAEEEKARAKKVADQQREDALRRLNLRGASRIGRKCHHGGGNASKAEASNEREGEAENAVNVKQWARSRKWKRGLTGHQKAGLVLRVASYFSLVRRVASYPPFRHFRGVGSLAAASGKRDRLKAAGAIFRLTIPRAESTFDSSKCPPQLERINQPSSADLKIIHVTRPR